MITVKINMKGLRLSAVQHVVDKYLEKELKGASITVERKEPATSRGARFDEAKNEIGNAKSTVEELRDELQDWLDNLPENLQGGDKASMIEEAISGLDDFVSSCEDAEGSEVDFPGMY